MSSDTGGKVMPDVEAPNGAGELGLTLSTPRSPLAGSVPGTPRGAAAAAAKAEADRAYDEAKQRVSRSLIKPGQSEASAGLPAFARASP